MTCPSVHQIQDLAELWCPALFFKKNGLSFLEYYEYLNMPLMSCISIELDQIIAI